MTSTWGGGGVSLPLPPQPPPPPAQQHLQPLGKKSRPPSPNDPGFKTKSGKKKKKKKVDTSFDTYFEGERSDSRHMETQPVNIGTGVGHDSPLHITNLHAAGGLEIAAVPLGPPEPQCPLLPGDWKPVDGLIN